MSWRCRAVDRPNSNYRQRRCCRDHHTNNTEVSCSSPSHLLLYEESVLKFLFESTSLYRYANWETLNSIGLSAAGKSAKFGEVKLLQWGPIFDNFVWERSSWSKNSLIKFVPLPWSHDICSTCSTKYLYISQNSNFSFPYEVALTQLYFQCFDSFFLPSKANMVFWLKGSIIHPNV